MKGFGKLAIKAALMNYSFWSKATLAGDGKNTLRFPLHIKKPHSGSNGSKETINSKPKQGAIGRT
jgi:hypothetical protein